MIKIKIKYATIMFEDKEENVEYKIDSFQVIDPDGEVYLFEIDKKVKANKEHKIASKNIKGRLH